MRKFLALVLALVMTMSLVTVSAGAATDFTDDASITNAEAVEVLNAIGILGGYADGSFRPQGVLTRGAGAKMVAYLMLGQDAADALKATYTVFEDVTDSVGLAPYIEWAAANGIVGGYGNGKFGPYDTLTQYAFGKMLLTAIGFDAAKEGYTGAGWQKNVFGDAYAKGIYDGTETYAACTRDDAARMVLAALESEFVVYGDAMIGNNNFLVNGHVVKFDGVTGISVNGAWDIGLFVWETYDGLTFNGSDFDVWGNPGDRWTYDDEEIGFYEDDYVVSYTTKVDDCSVLVDLGIPASSKKTTDLTFIYNGNFNMGGNDKDGFYFYADAFNYYTFGHKAAHINCDDQFVGGQGVLTKIFKNEYAGIDADYLVTEVATYLAEVTDVTKTHAGVTTTFDIDYRNLEGYGRGLVNVHDLHTDIADSLNAYTLTTDAYAEEDMALVTVNVANAWEDLTDALVIVDDELATATAGLLTGYVEDEDAAPLASVTKVDKVAERDAFGFGDSYGYADSKTAANVGTKFNFYYDNYGNVIGMFAISSTSAYAVVDALWSNHNKYLSAYADVVALDATMTEAANVVKFNGKAVKDLTENSIEEYYKDNEDAYAFYLYTYSVTDGDYTMSLAKNATGADKSTYYTDILHTADDDDFYADDQGEWVQMTNKTQILMRDVNGKYTAASGKNELPALTAESAEIIWDTNGYAKVVFLNNVTFLDARVTGFIVDADNDATEWIDGVLYYEYTFYVGDVATPVYVEYAEGDTVLYYGLYEAQFNAVDGNLVVKTLVTDLSAADTYTAAGAAEGNYGFGHVTKKAEGMVEVGMGDVIAEDLDDVTVYLVDMTSSGTSLEKVDADTLAVGDAVHVILNADKNAITTLYIIKQ